MHRLEAGLNEIEKDHEGGRRRKRGQRDGAGPAGIGIGGRIQDLRQPGARHPGGAGARERIEVRVGHGGVIDDPLPDPDVPVRIGVLQKKVAETEQKQECTRADAQMQQARRHAGGGHAVCDGERHQNVFDRKATIDEGGLAC